jgi:hypothetical protein
MIVHRNFLPILHSRRIIRTVFSRRETPFPCAGSTRPDGPSTRREAANPQDGD